METFLVPRAGPKPWLGRQSFIKALCAIMVIMTKRKAKAMLSRVIAAVRMVNFRARCVSRLRHLCRDPASHFIELFTVRANKTLLVEARKFTEFSSAKSPRLAHPHPFSQARRLNAQATMVEIGKAAGYKLYARSSSHRERNQGIISEKSYYTAADTATGLMYDPEPTGLVADVLTDVCYYMEIDDLFKNRRPIMCYCVLPGKIAGKGDDFQWYTEASRSGDAIHHERVSGGSHYTHRIWANSHDTFTVPYWFSMTTFDVQVIPGDFNRAVVVMVPTVTTYLPPWIYRLFNLKYNEYERAKIDTLATGHLMMKYIENAVTMVSIRNRSPDGSCVSVPMACYDACTAIEKAGKGAGITGIKFVCADQDLNTVESILLNSALGADTRLGCDVVNYTRSEFTDQGKPSAELVTHAIVRPATVMTKHPVNGEAAVQGRIEERRNPSDRLADDIVGFGKEFVEKSYPSHLPKLEPCSLFEALMSCCKTKAQKARGETYKYSLESGEIKSIEALIKVEAVANGAQNGKHSRLVFPENMATLIAVAMFEIPMKKHTLGMSREGSHPSNVGMTPDEIGLAVSNYANKTEVLICTDYTGMDATQNKHVNEIYCNAWKAGFAEKHHALIEKTHASTLNRTVKVPNKPVNGLGKKATKTNSGSMNLSGGFNTTTRNTVPNAFMSFVASRRYGRDVDESWDMIGPKFGDDGVTDGKVDIHSVAKELNFILKGKVQDSKDPVEYLSRVYPLPKISQSSHTLVMRALQKIPVVTHGKGLLGLKFRVNGYSMTETGTPLVKEYLNALKRVHGFDDDMEGATSDQMRRFERGPYLYEEVIDSLHVECIAKECNLSPIDVGLLRQHLDDVVTIEDLEKIRLPWQEASCLLPEGINAVYEKQVSHTSRAADFRAQATRKKRSTKG